LRAFREQKHLDIRQLEFSESVTEYRNQNGDLVITATGVGVQTERAVDS
tara:strand:- start:115 stop:261 length:147 start_codon:yes stop_codon:yes gene_type:complete